jgi:hypothetical protein
MKRSLPAIIALLLAGPTTGQNVTAFLDYMDRLHVFDHGVFKQIEPQVPQNYFVGGNMVVYTNARGDLRIYKDGRVRDLDRTVTDGKPIVTDHFAGFTIAGSLRLWDGRQTRMLTPLVGKFIVEDSIVVYKDQINRVVNAFYAGEVVQLEDYLAGDAMEVWKAGDNVFAWVSVFDRKLKAYYHGLIYELTDLISSVPFECGLDLVAFQDAMDRSFKVFHKGDIFDLDPLMPQRYQMGKGVMAWLDQSNALKVFSDGKIHTVQDFAPARWQVVDSLVVIEDQGAFRVFQDGRSYELSRVVPRNWAAEWGTLAYLDVDGTTKVWRKGHEDVFLRGEPVRTLRVDRGLVLAYVGTGARIWWRGALHSH